MSVTLPSAEQALPPVHHYHDGVLVALDILGRAKISSNAAQLSDERQPTYNVRALLQFETQALQDRLYESHGVREASWISLSGCHPNRCRPKVPWRRCFLAPSCMKSNEVRSEGIEKMKPVLENIETGNRPARI